MQVKSIPVTGGLIIDMVLVERGAYSISTLEQGSAQSIHQVSIPDFYIGKYQVIQETWESVMGNNPARFDGKNRPVEQVSWEDTQEFIHALKRMTGQSFRLPSESEWEYAARGGRYSQDYIYAGSDKLSQVGWYDDNSNGETHGVGLLLPNELGLYDMSGNVWEWCADDWHENYQGLPADGSAWVDIPDRGAGRVLRGGSYLDSTKGCRPAIRGWIAPGNRNDDIGFRLALSLQSGG